MSKKSKKKGKKAEAFAMGGVSKGNLVSISGYTVSPYKRRRPKR